MERGGAAVSVRVKVSVLKVTNLAYSRAGREGGRERWLEEEEEAWKTSQHSPSISSSTLYSYTT